MVLYNRYSEVQQWELAEDSTVPYITVFIYRRMPTVQSVLLHKTAKTLVFS